MSKVCEICEFIKNPQNQIIETKHWTVGIGDNHAYLGRAYVTLKSHKESLGELNDEEWKEYQQLVVKLEKAYKQAFGASPLNWGCFMNFAFQSKPYNPHVHWHIYPRYEVAPTVSGITFDDPLYGKFYDNNAERIVSGSVVKEIADKLKNNLE